MRYSAVKSGHPQEARELAVSGAAVRTVTLTGLDKYTQYLIQVLGYTRIGDGEPSTPAVVVRTNEDGEGFDESCCFSLAGCLSVVLADVKIPVGLISVPGPPVGLFFPDVTRSTAQIMWSPPTEPNGIVAGYNVTYREATNPENYAIVDNSLGPARRDFYVSSLSPETYYIFTVAARTRLGWGEAAAVRVFTITNRSKCRSEFVPSMWYRFESTR